MTLPSNGNRTVKPRPPGSYELTSWYCKRVLHCTESPHFKFYTVDIEEKQNNFSGEFQYVVTYTWGKIGTSGQSNVLLVPDKEKALHAMNVKIGEKLGKGYKELVGEAIYPADVPTVILPHEFEETLESQDKFDAFLNNLKV